MASGPITSWQIDGGTVTDFMFFGSKITVDGDCSHEIKRCLLLARNTMTNPALLKSRDITLLTKVHLVKAMVFPAVMYQCESWTIKKAERRRTDSFKLWCWRRLLRVPGTARRSNQSILKEINPFLYIGRIASLPEWSCVWVNSGRWWGQGSLACCSPWVQKESDTTERVNNN